MSKSNFEVALENLGFNTKDKQKALLKIFSFAGYLKPMNIWQDALHLLNNDDASHNKATSLWKAILAGLQAAKADEIREFNIDILLDHFQKYDDSFDIKFWENYLLYTCQHAFGRSVGQERYQIHSQEWMQEYAAEYAEAAKAIGLIDRIAPTRSHYDEAWLAGASRIGMMTRFIDYDQLLASGLKVDHSVALVGARPAWANIDGISPDMLEELNKAHQSQTNIDLVNVSLPVGEEDARIEEGKKYLMNLAQKEGIILDKDQPFIQYRTKDECPKGLFPNRWYPNYLEGSTKTITETILAADILKNYVTNTPISLCDTSTQNGERPNTATTSYDAANSLLSSRAIENMSDKVALHILLISNNPYIERQKLVAQEQANKAAKEYNTKYNTNITIEVDGAGFSAKQDVATVHSELAALVAEKWKTLHSGEDYASLLYSTRDKNVIDIPCPDLDIDQDAVPYVGAGAQLDSAD